MKIFKAFLYFLFIVFLSLYVLTYIIDFYKLYIDPPENPGAVEYIDYYVDFFSDTKVNFGLHIYGDKRRVIEEYDTEKQEEKIRRLQEGFRAHWGIDAGLEEAD